MIYILFETTQLAAFCAGAEMISSANLQGDNNDASEITKVHRSRHSEDEGCAHTLLSMPSSECTNVLALLALFCLLGAPPHESSVYSLPFDP